jgi:hypothetical protein
MNEPTLFDPPAAETVAPKKAEALALSSHRASGENNQRAKKCIGPKSRRNAPATSKAAARSVAGGFGLRAERVFACIMQSGPAGMTDHEISQATGILLQSLPSLRGGLAAIGRIVLNGAERPTPSGRNARVWVVAGHCGGQEGRP